MLAQMLNVTVEQDAALQPALAQHAHFAGLSANKGEARLSPPLLRALGDGLDFPPFLDAWTGAPDMGVVFFESAQVPGDNLSRAKDLSAVITGSGWNT